MLKRPPRPRTWLLSVVSAAALLPACVEEHEAQTDDELEPGEQSSGDAGRPKPPIDAGVLQGVVIRPDGGFVGTILQPPDATFVGSMVLPDAGRADDASSDASKDASCPDAGPYLNGLVFVPDDAGCPVVYPGILLRAPREHD